MELTKNDVKMTKGVAILFMVLLHLFCRKGSFPYEPIFFIGENPLVYYIGLFGDCCVVIYCFCSGYAHNIINQTRKNAYSSILKRLPFFIVQFWLVCTLFAVRGLIINDPDIPGSLSEYIGNILMYQITYNGAWWFVITYILLCIVSPIIMRLCHKSTIISLIIFSVIYFVSYLFRFNKISLLPDSFVSAYINGILAPFGTSLFPYVLGVLFYKHRIFTKLNAFTQPWKKPLKNLALVAVVLIAFLVHCFIETLFIAIFTGMAVIVCFNLWSKGKLMSTVFSFFGTHSTNIWLTHMFFYLVLFKDLVFVVKYPIFCLALMLLITIAISFVINFIMKLITTKTLLKKL